MVCSSVLLTCLVSWPSVTDPTHPAVWPKFRKRKKRPWGAVFWLIQPTNNAGCVSRAPSPSRRGSKSLPSLLPLLQTVDTSWWVKGVQRAAGGWGGGSRSGVVGVMIRDREVERELCLGLGMLQRCLIEGCFNAVWGWQVGIIIAICLRSRHPDWLLMAAACVVLPSTRGGFDFHYRVENIRSSLLLSSLGLHEDVGFCITDEALVGRWVLRDWRVGELIPECGTPPNRIRPVWQHL